jgi:23S rRNA (cytidine1920-2'-O)/16S rRNA (cytidine1409-2'-O)-methyltransferase
MTQERARLDELLVTRGFFATRSRARDAILRGTVTVAGLPATKPGQPVAAADEIAVDDPAAGYVSRAALKLVHALDQFGVDPAGRTALDLGASTGGFTQVLLERGAAQVFSIDVGHGQMAATLRGDPRVTLIEGLNARDLTAGHLDGVRPTLIVCDVSFISLKLALPPALEIAEPGAWGLFLVKPQFEAGRGKLSSGGILRGEGEAERIGDELRAWLDAQPGWRAVGLVASPIEGGDGNREVLLAGEKSR